MSNSIEVNPRLNESMGIRRISLRFDTRGVNSGLTFNDTLEYGFHEIIAELLELLDIKKLGSWYLFEYYKPDITWYISKTNKIEFNDEIKIYGKSLHVKYLNKFKLGLNILCILSNIHAKKSYKYDFKLIKTKRITFAFNDEDYIIKSYPLNVKIIDHQEDYPFIDFNLFKDLKYLEVLYFNEPITIKNIYELPIKVLSIDDENLEPDILKYFKSLTTLYVGYCHNFNMLNLTYFPKDLIIFDIWNSLSDLLVYPDTPFYIFLTNQVKELRIKNYENEDIIKLKTVETLVITHKYDRYILPQNVSYLRVNKFETNEIQKYIKKLLDNNSKLIKFECNIELYMLKDMEKFGFIKNKNNYTLKLNSREEMLQIINIL
jgi:hypothetical protein